MWFVLLFLPLSALHLSLTTQNLTFFLTLPSFCFAFNFPTHCLVPIFTLWLAWHSFRVVLFFTSLPTSTPSPCTLRLLPHNIKHRRHTLTTAANWDSALLYLIVHSSTRAPWGSLLIRNTTFSLLSQSFRLSSCQLSKTKGGVPITQALNSNPLLQMFHSTCSLRTMFYSVFLCVLSHQKHLCLL